MDAPERSAGEPPAPDQPAPSVPVPPAVDRQAAFAAGTPRMPRRVIYLTIAVLLALGVGGAIADHFVTSAPASPTSTRSPAGTRKPTVPDAPAAPAGTAQLHAPLSAFLGLSSLKGETAPGFTLTNAATGAPVSLAAMRGHVVVLTFANAACNDICPVLASELEQANGLLGTTKVPVTFVTVNTDPLVLTRSDAAILSATSLRTLSNWRFLTGSVTSLNRVWVSYGISITADRATGVASHNELMYFIGPSGTISWSATPVANESTSGISSLPAAEVTRFAQGIAHYADQLANAS